MVDTKSRVYFAARSHKTIGAALIDKVQKLENDWGGDNREEMENAWCHVYGRDVGYGKTSGVTRGGVRGELAMLRANNATTVARAKHAMVTAAKLTWKVQAKDGSSTAAKTCQLGNECLENEWKSNHLSAIASLWVERVVYFSESFIFAEWDRNAGPPLLAIGDTLVHQGDVKYHVVPPWDVFRDNTAKSFDACPWLFVRTWANRWDLARSVRRLVDGRSGDEAQEAILGACDKVTEQYSRHVASDRVADSDLVPVWHFFHNPSPALPRGRYVQFLSQDVVLRDETLRGKDATYEGRPVVRMFDKEMADTPHAWAVFWDTLGPQEILDGVDTALATRATTMSHPVIASEKGSDMVPEAFGPYRTWQYPRGAKPPQEVQWGKFPTELLNYRDALKTDQRGTMGLNDVSMGQPQGSEMNAQAFTVLYSAAVQQSAPLTENYTTAVAQLGTVVLKLKAKHVKQQRSFQSSGASKRTVKYTGADLASVDTVTVSVGNPMEQTAAGRKIILDDKIKQGWIISEAMYDECLATGRSEPASRRNEEEAMLIAKEYEMLCAGEVPEVDSWQNHQLHFRENSAAGLQTDDPVIRNTVEEHLEKHYVAQFGVGRAEDPLALVRERWMLGLPIGPGQEMAMAPPGAPPTGAPAEGGMPPPDAAPTAPTDVPPPTNPVTGSEFSPTDAGAGPAPV